jgi:hypothetical protein
MGGCEGFPEVSGSQVAELVRRLCNAQLETTERVLRSASFEELANPVPDGFTVQDVLRMWVWHFWTHHRDLVRARGALTDDDPHFHVPHFVRQAHEEFGRFIGELACLTDEQLDLRIPDGDSERSIRQIVEHVLDTLTTYIPEQVEAGCEQAVASGGSDSISAQTP